MLIDAKMIIAAENHVPRLILTPGMKDSAMSPRMINPPIFRNPPRKEKSFLVVNATIVIPATSAPVMNPALAMSAWPSK